MGRLDGKVAIITGAARGQGEATARLFAAEGAKVMLTDVLEAEGTAATAAIGVSARFFCGDLSSEEAWAQLVEATLAAFGHIDVLVNNAAITDHGPLESLQRSRFERILAVNVIGPVLGMQAVIPHMLRRGKGAIVNISSVNGLRGSAHMTAYDASKWAVRGVTKALAVEFAGRGIRINSVHPGAIRTPMLDPTGDVDMAALAKGLRIPQGRVAEPVEVAHASLFLASDEASYVNGAELAVDGAWSAGVSYVDQVDERTQQSQTS